MIALILARGGSKGIPDKNIKILSGKPLLCHTIQSAKKTKKITEIYVSSDSEKILELAENQGAIPIKRPDNISQDLSKDIDGFIHALPYLHFPENIVHLRATTPLIESKILDDAIDFFNENVNSCTSLRSVHKTSESVLKFYKQEGKYLVGICDNFGYSLDTLPRQILPSTYCPNGYIDILKTETFHKGETFYGNKILSFVTDYTPEVDTIEDFEYIEFLQNKKNV